MDTNTAASILAAISNLERQVGLLATEMASIRQGTPCDNCDILAERLEEQDDLITAMKATLQQYKSDRTFGE